MAELPSCEKIESLSVNCDYNFNIGSEHIGQQCAANKSDEKLPSVRGIEDIGVRYGYTVVFVKDVGLSLSFYRDAFGLQPKYVDERRTWGELDTGSAIIAFTPLHQRDATIACGVQEHDASIPPINVAIGFLVEGCKSEGLEDDKNVTTRVQSVQKVYDRAIDIGAVPVQAPEMKPWGQIVAYVRDPDGVLVQLGSLVKRSK
ncbi:hypothetical protein SUGI_0758840 [Cryptomeria japonica]|uniref:uncharacterized protein LOC131069219 n=1 Tax=Cryptomeria japonica TaxID=3369 RepID=UPI0024149386|nr:uncharacterized protein LOC131069219 [Cryptomeria japonica]GLJ37391.1 hypothetical protein SUGI_0758840 [Cryptomeria japonica]